EHPGDRRRRAAAIGGNLGDLAQRAPGRARHRGRGGAYAGRDQGGRRDQPVGHADATGLARSFAPGRAAPPHGGELPAPGGRRRSAEARELASPHIYAKPSWPGLSRPSTFSGVTDNSWMPGTRPGMTIVTGNEPKAVDVREPRGEALRPL